MKDEFDPPMTGSVTGCSMDQPSAPDAESNGQRDGSPATVPPAVERTCRYNWVGDRMRERLDALERERPQLPHLDITPTYPSLCHREYCDTHRGGKCNCVYP